MDVCGWMGACRVETGCRHSPSSAVPPRFDGLKLWPSSSYTPAAAVFSHRLPSINFPGSADEQSTDHHHHHRHSVSKTRTCSRVPPSTASSPNQRATHSLRPPATLIATSEDCRGGRPVGRESMWMSGRVRAWRAGSFPYMYQTDGRMNEWSAESLSRKSIIRMTGLPRTKITSSHPAGLTLRALHHRPTKHDRLRIEAAGISHALRRGGSVEAIHSRRYILSASFPQASRADVTWEYRVSSHHISYHHALVIVPPRPAPQSASTHPPQAVGALDVLRIENCYCLS
ncbi:uncharacterized protein LY79DRAFT_570092, partial [Colletotrichum navitas]